jgi:PST family polysaccharide transporter
MEDKAVRGIPVSLVTFASNKVLTLATTIVLARLLAPADFGLLALAVLTVSLLSMFNDLGLGGAVVIRGDLDDRAKGTALTVMIAASAALGLMLVAAAPALAGFFGEDRLDSILMVIATNLFLSGPVWFYETVLQRELEFGKRFISKSVQTVTLASVALTLALLGAGVWSLVAGHVAAYVAYGTALFILTPYRVRPAFDGATARDLFRTGRGFLAQGGVSFIQQNMGHFTVGRVLGAAELGFYSMAFRLSQLPNTAIAEPVATVTFPAFARMRNRGEAWGASFLSTLRLIALVCCPLAVLVSATAEPLTDAVFGEKWASMIGPLSVLALWGAVRPLEATVSWLHNSIGMAGHVAKVSAVSLVALIPALIIAASASGVVAVAWVIVAHVVGVLAALAVSLQQRAGLPVFAQVKTVFPIVLAALIAWATARIVVEASAAMPAGGTLGVSVAAGAAAYVAVLSAAQPGLLREALGQASRTLRRPPTATKPAVSVTTSGEAP